MAFNSEIRDMAQYDRGSSYQSEAAQLERLNELRRKLEDKSYTYEQELLDKKRNKELKILEYKYKTSVKYEELLQRKKNTLDDKSYKKWEARLKKRYQKELQMFEANLKAEEAAEKEAEEKRRYIERRASVRQNIFNGKKDIRARVSDIVGLGKEQGFGAVVDSLVSGIADLAKTLDNQIDEIASYQSKIDTRLQGSGKKWEGGFMGLNKGLSQTITGLVGISPLIQQQRVVENLNRLVEKGIAYNVEQRAFLETISEKIATTFDAANGTLLQLVRVQQSDTTAARLGMEGYLTRYLNKMFQTTEYLSDVSDSVSSSLYEATALLSSTEGVGFEAQVQKWLGALYSVGMSSTGVQNIAQALGMLGSGNISGLAGNTAMQNLLVMAASRSGGKTYAELLKQGLDGSEVNKLMKAMVEYLAEIAQSNNNVIKSQLAGIFGMSTSDLKSVMNVIGSADVISRMGLDYSGAMQELFSQAGQMYSRTNAGEFLKNIWENTKYGISSGIATNPALYGIWKIASLLEDTVGGIALPDIKYLGTGVNLQTTVADIMRVGAMSGGILNSLGAIIGAGSGAGFSPEAMLKSLGITTSTVSVLTRGQGLGSLGSGVGVSESAYIGGSGSDALAGTYAGIEDTKQEELAKVKPEDEVTTKDVNDNVTKIYNLFDSIVDSINGLKVTVTNIDAVVNGLNR